MASIKEDGLVSTGEQILRQVLEHVEEVFWLMNAEHTEMIYISPGYEQIWGRTCQALIEEPMSWLDPVHPDDKPRVLESFTNHWQDGFDETYRIIRPDGMQRWIRDRAFPVYNDQGEVYRVAGIAEDITAYVEKNESLIYAYRESDNFFEWSAEFLALMDMEGYLLRVNPHWTEVLGYAEHELIGRKFTDFINSNELETARDFLEKLDHNKLTVGFEIRFDSTQGKSHVLEWHARVVDSIIYATARDVTERRETENKLREAKQAAETLSEAKTAFLSRVSHELRTPLNAVLGFAQLLETDKGLAPRQLKYVAHLKEAAEHLLGLVNDVLDLSRIETGKITLLPEWRNLNDIVARCTKILAVMAHDYKVDINIMQAEYDFFAHVDQRRLSQIMLNLLSNAIKYNQPNGQVYVSFNKGKDGDLFISVQDTGRGISVSELKNLFEPFNRLGKESTGIDGVGIGLSICRMLAQLMGGDILVESQEGKGSTFTLQIPYEQTLPSIKH